MSSYATCSSAIVIQFYWADIVSPSAYIYLAQSTQEQYQGAKSHDRDIKTETQWV